MNKQLVVLTFAAFGAFMLNASAAGVADLHAAKGQDCAACHMEGKPSSSNVSEASRSEERRVGKECRSRWSPYH